MASTLTSIKKLQKACNLNGYRIVYSTSQFYSKEQDRPITMYLLKEAVPDNETDRFKYIELIKTPSQIQVLMYLVDLWDKIKNAE